jgi:hypothetical protein
MPAPKGADKAVRMDAVASQRVAYYQSEDSVGVLAPRDWHGFGTYGSSGLSLTVTPRAIKSADLRGEIAGPVIQVSMINGDSGGRFTVARVIARVFPTQRGFVESVIKERHVPAGDFPFGPYPKDKLTYRNKLVVEFQTSPHSEGLGTVAGFKPNDEPIKGVAIINLEDEIPSLEILTVRFMPDNADLTSQIIQQFEQDCGVTRATK